MYTKLIIVVASFFVFVKGRFQLSLELAELAREIPGGGIPGMDYPILGAIPDTGFICRRVGYFPDAQVNCQVFHVCSYSKPTMIKDSYLCPNGTTFNVYKRGCDWWFNSDCVQHDIQNLAREIKPSEVTKSFHTGTVAIAEDAQNSSVFTIIPASTDSSSVKTTMWNVDNAGTSIFTIMPTKTTHVPSMVISSRIPSNITRDPLRPIEYTRTPDGFENTNIVNNIKDIVAGLIPEVSPSSLFNFSLPLWPVGLNFSFPTVTTESNSINTEFDATPTPEILDPEDTTTLGDSSMLFSDMEEEDSTIIVKLPGGNKVKVTATSDGPVPNIEIETKLTQVDDMSETSDEETNDLPGNKHTSDGNLKPVNTIQDSPTEYPYFKSDSQDFEDTTIGGPLNNNKEYDDNNNKNNYNGNNNSNNSNSDNNNDFDLVTEYPNEPTTWHYQLEHGILKSPSAFPTLANENDIGSGVIQPEVIPFDNNDENGNKGDTKINPITALYNIEPSTESPSRLDDIDYDSFMVINPITALHNIEPSTEFPSRLDDIDYDSSSNMNTQTENVIHFPNNVPSISVLSEQDNFEYVTTYSPLPSNHDSETESSILNASFTHKPSQMKPSISQGQPSNLKPRQPTINETETNSVYRKVDDPEYGAFPQDTFMSNTEDNFAVNEKNKVSNRTENQPSIGPPTELDDGNNIEETYPSVDEDINFDFETEAPLVVTKATTIPTPPSTLPTTKSSTTITTTPVTTQSTRIKIPLTRKPTTRPRLTPRTRRTTTNLPPTTSNLNPLLFNNEEDAVYNPLLRTDLEPFVPTAMPVNRCSQVKITRNGELPADAAALARNIPGGGVPGVDYPILAGVIRSNFHCEDFATYGYYADPQACCQMYHVCHPQGIGWKRDSFICPNGTIFNQKVNVCDWWYNSDCSQTENFYPAKRKARGLF